MTYRFKCSLVLIVLVAFLGHGSAQAPQNPLARLTKLSDREYVDMAKVDFVRLSACFDLTAIGGDPNFCGGDSLLVNGASVGFSEAAEDKVRQLLGAPPRGSQPVVVLDATTKRPRELR